MLEFHENVNLVFVNRPIDPASELRSYSVEMSAQVRSDAFQDTLTALDWEMDNLASSLDNLLEMRLDEIYDDACNLLLALETHLTRHVILQEKLRRGLALREWHRDTTNDVNVRFINQGH